MPTEATAGGSSSSNHDHALVADRPVVPDSSGTPSSTTPSTSSISDSSTNSYSTMANDKQIVESRRLAIISSKYTGSALNTHAQTVLLNRHLELNAHQSYQRGQRLFIEWSMQHQISPQSFSPTDLINFLSDMYATRTYAVSTLQIFRSAVTHLHNHPNSIRNNDDINAFIITLLRQAPPLHRHRPSINIQRTIDYLVSLTDPSLADLQRKLVFLLGITCFLRPSDLHRIPLSSVQLSPDRQLLSFSVHKPKEKRRHRHIVKTFQVKCHIDARICPIQTFLAFQRRRPAGALPMLFINSIMPSKPLSVRTIQRWISRLLQISTTEPRVSLRSIGSSLALQVDIPKEDIVTLGNWASFTTFEHHYRREHLSHFDFTNTLISLDGVQVDDQDSSDNDTFFDASDSTLD